MNSKVLRKNVVVSPCIISGLYLGIGLFVIKQGRV